MSKRWGAVLRGHDFDLQDWREMLKPPFDPWVEVHGSDAVLRSESLDGLTSANEVRDRVVAHIDRLNGAMFVMRQSHPLQFSGVVEENAASGAEAAADLGQKAWDAGKGARKAAGRSD
jgi:hypothetical protein